MKVSNVYTQNLNAFIESREDKLVIENRGGQGSSKTTSILQALKTICLESEKKRLITISSYALPHLKAGAMRDFDKILFEDGIDPQSVKKETSSIYSLNKSIIEFVGIEGNEARVTGPRRDILYINEINNRISYEVFDLMNSRTHECTFVDYNPRSLFWLNEKFNPNFRHKEIISTFLDNPYLPKSEIESILSKKDKPGFENWWKVYGLGQFGSFEGTILPNWEYGEFIPGFITSYGLDFGVKDPDALIKVSIDKKAKIIYCQELLYKSGLSTDQLAILIRQYVTNGNLIIADSANTRTINDLRSRNINIRGVKKNRIIDDIKTLSDYKLIITPDSINLAKELNNWCWLDKKGEVPIDDFNHLLDALRYIVSTLLDPNKKRGQKF